MSAIQNMPQLLRLDLGYSPSTRVLGANPNAIDDRGIIAIVNYLTTNRTLSHLYLQGMNLDARYQSLLAAALMKNQTLSHLLISGKLNPEITSILDLNRSIALHAHCTNDLSPQTLRNATISSIWSIYR
jgi:hypothetical protein